MATFTFINIISNNNWVGYLLCGKLHFNGYDIATNAHLDETINWQPKLNK